MVCCFSSMERAQCQYQIGDLESSGECSRKGIHPMDDAHKTRKLRLHQNLNYSHFAFLGKTTPTCPPLKAPDWQTFRENHFPLQPTGLLGVHAVRRGVYASVAVQDTLLERFQQSDACGSASAPLCTLPPTTAQSASPPRGREGLKAQSYGSVVHGTTAGPPVFQTVPSQRVGLEKEVS